MKRYLLQSAKNDVLENNLVLLQGTKIHHIQCIARKFFCQILLCSSIHNNFGCIEVQGDVMTDCLAQSDTNAFSQIQLFVLEMFCCNLCADQSNGLGRWFCNHLMHHILNNEGVDTSYIHQIKKNT